MLRRFLAASLVLASCAPASRAPVASAPAPSVSAAPVIGADELRRDLTVFASDSFRGRETGTPDADRAARFLAGRLAELGLEPAGDSGYFQRVPLTERAFGPGTRISVTSGGSETELRLGADLVPLLNLGAGAPPPKLNAQGELVFASYGLSDPALRRDDFAGLDLRGKVVVVVNGAPPGVDSAKRATLESLQAVSLRLAQLLPRGPAAVVVLLSGASGEQYGELANELLHSMTVGSPDQEPELPDTQRPIPMILLGLPRAGSPLMPAGWPASDGAQALGGRRMTAHIELSRRPVRAYNVVGIVRGRDSAMSRSYVAYGAHYDHIGIQRAVGDDSIANGADDDGSGSVTLLALARAFAQAPEKPRRSVLFVWHVAEEKGLLGSAHFTDNPTVPIDSIIAQINADMIGRNGADTLFVVGPAAAPNGQSRALGRTLDAVNARQPRPFTFDRGWDSPTHPEQIYFRSDHYNYARKGIPIVFLTTGVHPQYHKVTDEVPLIDFAKMARVAQLMYDLGAALAADERRPRMNAGAGR